MKKIVFVGAGMAALVASEKLARSGKFEVHVYEKSDYDTLSYDWHDDINKATYIDNGLPLPKEGTYFTKRNWSFIPPSEGVEVTLDIPEDALDWSTERRLLARQYADRAADVVNFHFGCEVEGLIVDGGAVKGVVVGGESVYADLVVDNSGALSKLRASLPSSAHIDAKPSDEDIFVAYRGFHAKVDGAPEPENSNRAYLRPCGVKGISWSIKDPSGTVNVLIGQVGKMSKEELKQSYSRLKASNPQISDDIVRGGRICVIPIRRPLTRMVADGYVAIGDSAFMTVPMIGSGVENSVKAACILADVILDGDSLSPQALWQYQVRYYLDRGANHMGVDILKRWLLSCKPTDLDWLFEKGVVGAREMAAGATGQLITLGLSDIFGKLKAGIGRLDLLLALSGVIGKTQKAAKLGKAIPTVYDERKIAEWEKKVNALFKRD